MTSPDDPTKDEPGQPRESDAKLDAEARASAEQAAQGVTQAQHDLANEPTEKIGVGELVKPDQEPTTVAHPVVEFEAVEKTYNPGQAGEYTAITDISFTVEDTPGHGEMIAILGPSGCGKSTILKLIAGLTPQHPPTHGEVRVQGKRVVGPGADRGMVFQDYTSFDHRTVLENVAFGLECRGVPQAERMELARDWVGRVGLNVEADGDKFPHELSGGMRQRVAIARTLILQPRIILMDEPFGALDPSTRQSMQNLLVDLWRDVQATVFFVTHSIEEAVYLGDRIYVLTTAPGRIFKQLRVEPPNRPAEAMQREAAFQETVFYIRDVIQRMEMKAAKD